MEVESNDQDNRCWAWLPPVTIRVRLRHGPGPNALKSIKVLLCGLLRFIFVTSLSLASTRNPGGTPHLNRTLSPTP